MIQLYFNLLYPVLFLENDRPIFQFLQTLLIYIFQKENILTYKLMSNIAV